MRVTHVACAVLLPALLCSCSLRSGAVSVPNVDAQEAAQAALEQYDKNGDQMLSAEEIEKSALSLPRWDANQDGKLSEDEISERLTRFYRSEKVGMIGVTCKVMLNRRGLEGAKVVFEPEAFLGDAIHPAMGTTGAGGDAVMSVAEEHRPQPNLQGVQTGLYRVKITHPQANLRSQFNTDTVLTYENSPVDDPVMPVFVVSQ